MKSVHRFTSFAAAVLLALPAMAQWTRVGSNTYTTNLGDNVGIGTTNPTQKLYVVGQNALIEFFNPGSSGAAIGMNHARGTSGAPASLQVGDYGGTFVFNGYTTSGGYANAGRVDSIITAVNSTGLDAAIIFQPASQFGGNFEAMRVAASGRVGIGVSNPTALLDVAGTLNVASDVTVAGNIAAKYQDVAEWVPASEQMPAGTVVVLDRQRSNQVVASSAEYDTAVAGVVSDKPGLLLGEKSDSKVKVATTGRVKVRVDATHHPIAIGDLLVTSAKSGVAMYSEPVDIHGKKFHLPGSVIGKALEPLASGEGEILVLLSLQ